MGNVKKVRGVISKWNDILSSKQKRQSVQVFVAIIMSSVLETIGVSIMIPFMSTIMDAERLLDNKYVNLLTKYFHIKLGSNDLILLMGILVILIYIAKNIGLVWTDFVGLRYESQVQKDFALLMLKSYIYRPYEDSLDINSAEVLRGIGNDATALYYIIQASFKILANVFTILLIGIFLMVTDPIMAIGIVLISGGLSVIIIFLMKKRISKSGRLFNEAMLNQTKTAMQVLGGLKELTVMNRRDKFVSYHEEATEIKRNAELKYRFLQTFPHRIIETIFILSVIGTVCIRIVLGMEVINIVPQLAAFAVAAIRILPLVNSTSDSNTTIIYYMPSFNNAYENIMASKKVLNKKYSEQENIAKQISFQDKIIIKDIKWKYRAAQCSVFEDLHIEISRGEAVGIMGKSGAGKTTLADIILGLLTPSQGSILIDGEAINLKSPYWSKLVGYVPQTVFLLDDTIRNNIFFGIEDEDKSDAQVWKVVEEACLKEFVENLPNGLDTVVGERGAKISGGQRQRIAIARALYYNPEILVLDEATSALDSDTENIVMEAVERLQGEKTLIIIAHRLSTLEKCDKVYEIKDGKASRTIL